MSEGKKELIDLILARKENEQIDFKKKYYEKDKKFDLIKDIVSFANNINQIDKYIVFGIENDSWIPVGIDKSSLPDISQINDLLHMYVEPFINVELGDFKYQDVTIGFIRIPHDSLNRPYIIAKEYNKNRASFLRKGDIYIRKGASNFICERNDLDNIYNNKGYLDISFYNEEIIISSICINGSSYLMGQVRLVIQNNTPKTIVFDDVRLFVNCRSNLLEHKIDFIQDQKQYFNQMPEYLSNIPIKLMSGDCIQKTAFFEISEVAARNLSNQRNSSIMAYIKIFDVFKHSYQNTYVTMKLKFTDDLLKRWSY